LLFICYFLTIFRSLENSRKIQDLMTSDEKRSGGMARDTAYPEMLGKMGRSMYRQKLILHIFVLIFFFPGMICTVYGKDAGMSDVLITNNREHVLVYAKVVNYLTEEIRAAVMAGVPTTFTYFIDLYRERPYWMDKRISSSVFHHTVKYDNVKKLFLVSFSNRKDSAEFSDLDSAMRAMVDLNGVAIAPMKELVKNKTYYILIKAKLEKVKLPFYMKFLFFFVSLWDFETAWYKQGFIY